MSLTTGETGAMGEVDVDGGWSAGGTGAGPAKAERLVLKLPVRLRLLVGGSLS